MNGILQSKAANVSMANRKVTLYEMADGVPVTLAEAVTDGSGAFVFPDTPYGHFRWASTSSSDQIILMVIIGTTKPPDGWKLNELTTVAACYAGAQFISARNGSVSFAGTPFQLAIVAAMNANLVDVATGSLSSVMTSSPNGGETDICPKLLSLANLVTTWVEDPAAFDAILSELAAMPDGTQPDDTIDALACIARNPATSIDGIYVDSQKSSAYGPALQYKPNDWTVVVKVNDSGSPDNSQMFGGPGSLVFDNQGRAWIPNNVTQGGGFSAPYSIVLDMSGRPATRSDGTRMSPLTGGGIYGAGLGVAVDNQQNAWIGDFGWGGEDYWPAGSVSVFDPNGNALSPDGNGNGTGGFTQGGVSRIQGTMVDDQQNVWMACYGNGKVVVYRGILTPDGYRTSIPPTSYATYQGPKSCEPFCIAFAADGSAWATNSHTTSSGIVHLTLNSSSTLESSPQIDVGQTLKGIVIDSSDYIWVASGGDDTVYVFDSEGNKVGAYQGGGIEGPWGIALDGDDNLWVGNFGPIRPGTNFDGCLSQLAGAKATGHAFGSALTPQYGYRLRTGGSPVTLHDGTPLYGKDGPECKFPMMRTTGLNIDAAGNVWTCNNWKPDFDFDIGLGTPGKGDGNPGGDGMLIWVGLAKPVQRSINTKQ
jgi:hypothetical protein